MTEMTPEERERYDARADLEAWEWAREILELWTETARKIGSDELTHALEVALGHAEDRILIAQEKETRLREKGS